MLDAAYADAMLDVTRRFPADDDVAVLAAEAAMDTSPWNYWEADTRAPVGRSSEAVRLIETVLGRNPAHVQANHLYIHLMRSEEHTSELQSLMRISYAVFCLKKKKKITQKTSYR